MIGNLVIGKEDVADRGQINLSREFYHKSASISKRKKVGLTSRCTQQMQLIECTLV